MCTKKLAEEEKNTCGDNAKGQATSLVKILTGDCQGGCINKPTTQTFEQKEKMYSVSPGEMSKSSDAPNAQNVI